MTPTIFVKGVPYGRGFEGPDRHNWEVMRMDEAAVEQRPHAFAAAAA